MHQPQLHLIDDSFDRVCVCLIGLFQQLWLWPASLPYIKTILYVKEIYLQGQVTGQPLSQILDRDSQQVKFGENESLWNMPITSFFWFQKLTTHWPTHPRTDPRTTTVSWGPADLKIQNTSWTELFSFVVTKYVDFVLQVVRKSNDSYKVGLCCISFGGHTLHNGPNRGVRRN